MELIEIDCELSEDNNKFIEFMLSSSFPLYYQSSTEGYSFFGHSFLDRNKNNKDVEGDVNSPYWEFIHKLFKEICVKYHIKSKIIYRSALNMTSYNTNKMGDLHVDHDFAHKNFLMYLNDFSNGSTYIQDEDTKEIKEIKAKKYKVVIFGGHMHAQGFCGNGERRAVLVVTFN
jgi:hypothetical protein